MQEAGWIERRPDPTDRRARRLFLTDKARPVLGRIWDVAIETQDQVLAALSPDDADHLLDLLRRVHGAIADRSPARPALPGARVAAIRPLVAAPVGEGTR
jgi:DNA-binding MarR family transcriptional regulator